MRFSADATSPCSRYKSLRTSSTWASHRRLSTPFRRSSNACRLPHRFAPISLVEIHTTNVVVTLDCSRPVAGVTPGFGSGEFGITSRFRFDSTLSPSSRAQTPRRTSIRRAAFCLRNVHHQDQYTSIQATTANFPRQSIVRERDNHDWNDVAPP